MPHTPRHGNRNRNIRTYTNVSTGERYSGNVVEIQGRLYTTTSGVLEGDSQEVKASAPQRTVNNTRTRRQMRNTRNQNGMNNGNGNQNGVVRNQGMTGTMVSRGPDGNPRTIRRGNPRGQGPITRQFRARANTYYYDKQYNNPVPQGTPLHMHQNGEVMTEHVPAGAVMSDNSVLVYSASEQMGKSFRTGVDTSRNNPNGMMRTSMSRIRNYSTNISNRTSLRRGLCISNTRIRMQRRRSTSSAGTRGLGSGTMRRGGGNRGGY